MTHHSIDAAGTLTLTRTLTRTLTLALALALALPLPLPLPLTLALALSKTPEHRRLRGLRGGRDRRVECRLQLVLQLPRPEVQPLGRG